MVCECVSVNAGRNRGRVGVRYDDVGVCTVHIHDTQRHARASFFEFFNGNDRVHCVGEHRTFSNNSADDDSAHYASYNDTSNYNSAHYASNNDTSNYDWT